MLGKTHMAVGVASSLLLLPPANIQELVLGTGAAAIGAVISDIDVGTSESHKEADKIIAVFVLIIAAMIAVEYVWHLGLYNKIIRSTNAERIVMAVAGFLLICAFGKEQPHRSFMHSVLGMVSLTGCVTVFLPVVAPYFAVAFLSHLAIDFLNRKGLKLLFPMKKGFSLDLCSSSGLINRCMLWLGTVASVGLFVFRLGDFYIW
ncbi:MAG: metal-dependent hydrolase [Eubacteriales bacterium]|nr:metal-dependent hydrolase [Eubacteriales bacterium]